jgi:V/A-type H+-transporting ATPase subunit I
MSIVKMKRLRMAAMKQDRDELLALLQRMGCVEIDEPSVEESQLKRPEGEGLALAREGRSGAERALAVLRKYAPEKKGMLTPRPELTVEQLLDAQKGGAAEQAGAINELDRRMAAIHADIAKKQTEIQTLAPWLELDIPLECGSTSLVGFHLGVLSLSIPFETVEKTLLEITDLMELTTISTDRERQYLLLACHASLETELLDAMKQFGWSRVGLRSWTGTAAENTRRLKEEIALLEQELAEIEAKLSTMGGERGGIQILSDCYETQEDREVNRTRSLDTEQVFFIEGWISAEDWPALEKALEPMCSSAEPSSMVIVSRS